MKLTSSGNVMLVTFSFSRQRDGAIFKAYFQAIPKAGLSPLTNTTNHLLYCPISTKLVSYACNHDSFTLISTCKTVSSISPYRMWRDNFFLEWISFITLLPLLLPSKYRLHLDTTGESCVSVFVRNKKEVDQKIKEWIILFVIWHVHIPACKRLSHSFIITLSGAVARIPDLHDDRDNGHSRVVIIRRLRERLAGHCRDQVSHEAELWTENWWFEFGV